jgi:tRNA (mo5U34)-methyltransferase
LCRHVRERHGCMTTLQERVDGEPYWFHRMPLVDGVVTPGWSDVVHDKLPYFGLPPDMRGLRVLDVGSAEGFFSFEAERRGAAEVVSVDYDPECAKRFGICAEALGSRIATPQVMSVYELDPHQLGTFDVVMCFGLLYHVAHPLLALEKIAAVTKGTLLLQSFTLETASSEDVPLARFQWDGIMSGPPEHRIHDPTVFWEPNARCIGDMLRHVGFAQIERLASPKPPLRSSLVKRLRPRKYPMWNSSAQFRARKAS